MKAAIHAVYGPPEVVQIQDIDKPVPKDNEVMIKVYASTVNRTDAGFRSAEYFISRFWSGLLRPRNQILGCEFAGVVDETGKNVSLFKKGDKVFGYNDKTWGGHSEYLTIGENDAIAIIPGHLNFQESAPITEGGHYALNNIRAAKVKNGQNVIVYGATGAIGSAAVQLLKYFGARVTAVCDTANVDLVRSLGADTVIDYQTQDYTKTDQKYDFFFDAVGKSSFSKSWPLLQPRGVYISTELGKFGQNIYFALTTPLLGGKHVLFPIPAISQADVNFFKDLAESGSYKPVIDRVYNLDQIVEAYRYVESGRKIGNVVLRIVK
jgi:NADPH:quinone reductase-like Zn-dependent oxidoreductase